MQQPRGAGRRRRRVRRQQRKDFAVQPLWMTRSTPRLCYRLLPKCGCSSIGQVLHYLDHGNWYPGRIQDAPDPFLRGKSERDEVSNVLLNEQVTRFTFVRNPYKRLLSAYGDKIHGIQRSGRRYRRGAVHNELTRYGAQWNESADLVTNFRAFVRLVADTVELNLPMEADPHWRPISVGFRVSTFRSPTWRLDFVGHLENFHRDFTRLLQHAGIDPARLPTDIPRENSSELPQKELTAYYGPEEVELMQRIYADDFRIFHYSADPNEVRPLATIDVNELNDAVRSCRQPVDDDRDR